MHTWQGGYKHELHVYFPTRAIGCRASQPSPLHTGCWHAQQIQPRQRLSRRVAGLKSWRGNSCLHSLHFTRSSLPCPPRDNRSLQSSHIAKYNCFSASRERKCPGSKLCGCKDLRHIEHSYSFSCHAYFLSGRVFCASHAKQSARLVRVRCFFHCSRRVMEKACKGFVMSFFFVIEHLWHLTFTFLHDAHKHRDEELWRVVSFPHHSQWSLSICDASAVLSFAISPFIHCLQNRSMPFAITSSNIDSLEEGGKCDKGFTTSSPARSEQPLQNRSMESGHFALD